MRKGLFLLVVIISGLIIAAGIKISPATFVIQDVKPGEVIDIYQKYGHIIRVFGAMSDVTYNINSVKPSDSNTKITGYVDVHDPTWFWPELDTLFVPGIETNVTENPIYLNVPEDKEWYNRHYLIGVNVSPVIRENVGSLVLGAFLQFRIETESKKGIVPTVFEDKEYVFAPSVIDLGEIEREKEYIEGVDIYTGIQYPHAFTLSSLDPQSPVAKITILTSPGYRRIPDSSWVFYDKEYRIAKQQPAKAYISTYVPARTPQGRYEELVFLESKFGNAFLRVKFIIKD